MKVYNDDEQRLVNLFEAWASQTGADIADHRVEGAFHIDRASWDNGGEYTLLRCVAAPGSAPAPFGEYEMVWRQRFPVAVAWFEEHIERAQRSR